MIAKAGIFEFFRTETGGAEGGCVDGFDDAGGGTNDGASASI